MRRLLVVLTALVLATGSAACSDDDDGDVAATDRSTSTSSVVGGDTATGDTAPAAVGEETGTTVKGRTRAPATTAAPAPTTPPPPAPANATFTAPGRYSYLVNGTRGGQTIKDQPATLTVDPPNGADQHSAQQTQQAKTDQVLRRQTDGTYLVHLKITFGFISKEFRPAQPVLFAPLPPTIGRTWSWEMTSTDNATTVKGSFKIVRNEAVQVGGESVDTVVVEAELVTSGDVNQRVKSTVWTSPRYSLPVQTTETTTGGPAPGNSTSKLQSTRPA
jgi:hypothetical protein